ncbi:uncharacterized protein RAG0_09438 [Rhynchosporium agropyri]|uniref:Uncharacterized protein n=1 Tax=Rhynchosporium agropyri TaxID=914238 RepID=A0A1E1KVG8_9HELO|nr:uncharacterized protein RAG0_09438 [Rhynchosporium agropyri]
MHASSLAGWLAGRQSAVSVVQCSAAEAGRPGQAGKNPPSSLEPERTYGVLYLYNMYLRPPYRGTGRVADNPKQKISGEVLVYLLTHTVHKWIRCKVRYLPTLGSSEVAFPHCGMLDWIQGILECSLAVPWYLLR